MRGKMSSDNYRSEHRQETAILPADKIADSNDIEIINLKKEFYELKKINSTLLLCINTLYDSNDGRDAINYRLATIAGYHNADRAYIFEVTDDERMFRNTFEWKSDAYPEGLSSIKSFPMKRFERWLDAFEKNGYIYIESLNSISQKDSSEFEILSTQKIESLMAVPLYKHGTLTGMIVIGNPKSNTESMTLLKSVATFLIGDLERWKYMDQLYNLSYHDKMTGLQNRHAYIKKMKELERTSEKANAKRKKLGIIFADINGLKAANDNYGHEKGDEMIITASTILKTICATTSQSEKSIDSDSIQRKMKKTNIYRIGGDEFVVFFEDIKKKIFEEKVEEMKKHPIISVGSIYLEKCENIEKHVIEADKRMYEEKKKWHGEN